ncbi:MAG: S-layer-like protein [uncultured bacterium]|nr:MAG: S-layer-like protein [uncultured bacterium]HBY73785.1 hypothetical protein [Candidatus Kerfeldbacteria bacterium]
MPTSSDQVEDIFESSGIAEPVLTPVESVPPPIVVAPQRSYRRLILIVAICLVALLLLGGIGFGVWWWAQPDAPINVNEPIINETVVTVPENVNTTPINLNTTVNTNTAPVATFVDVDHDGLSDAEELVENTNPKKKDTDEDGLSDREEVRVYNTDPRNPDTDGDGYTDGNEVTHFYHPNSPDPKKRLFDLPQ